jgi:hypothetical protein
MDKDRPEEKEPHRYLIAAFILGGIVMLTIMIHSIIKACQNQSGLTISLASFSGFLFLVIIGLMIFKICSLKIKEKTKEKEP